MFVSELLCGTPVVDSLNKAEFESFETPLK